MFSINQSAIPQDGLLNHYSQNGAYTDCFVVEVNGEISFDQFLYAFYTTKLFKLERFILKWIVAKPSTDQQAKELASGEATSFAAWKVENKSSNQILLCDYQGKTRSWLMLELMENNNQSTTRLYFGSAVVPQKNNKTGDVSNEWFFRLLLGLHTFYSKALLFSAQSRLKKLNISK